MKIFLNLKEVLICQNPDCKKPIEDGAHGEAINYVIPNKIGSVSTHECGWCLTGFTAKQIDKDSAEFNFNDFQNE